MSADDRTARRRVLVVEDDASLRAMLQRALIEMEFNPTGAASGEAALELLETVDPEIILADIRLPGISGLELCRRVRQNRPQVEILILTAFGNLESAQQAIRLDAVDFLTKPISLSDLEHALDRALRRRLRPGGAPQRAPNATNAPDSDIPLTLQDVEREHILEVLARHNGNRRETAHELGISERTLYYRLAEFEPEQAGDGR